MRKKAFTLIELLVVISIISLLMAIMVPALARARVQGKSMVCLSNLRQLAVAAEVYAGNYDGYYPIAYTNDPDPTDSLAIYACWDFVAVKDWASGDEYVEPGILWEGHGAEKIHQCPSFRGGSNTRNDPYTGYNYNTSYIGHGSNEAVVRPAKTTQVKRPVRCALFGDGEYSDGANKFMRSPWKSKFDRFPFRSAGTQGYRHGGGTNVAWCDGHASSQKELFTNTEASEQAKIEEYNAGAKTKVGFLSADDGAYELE